MTATTENALAGMLSPERAADLAQDLTRAAESGATTCVGAWCSVTGFAAFVDVVDGIPALWQFAGPMAKTTAAHWLEQHIAAWEKRPQLQIGARH